MSTSDTIATQAGVPVDRAAVPILRQLSDSEPLRPGDLAGLLAVEAPHVTRQIQRLEATGYVERIPDPDDRRAHLIRLTPAGRQATDRILVAARQLIWHALAEWTPQDREQLASLFHRMVDDFIAHAATRGITLRGTSGA